MGSLFHWDGLALLWNFRPIIFRKLFITFANRAIVDKCWEFLTKLLICVCLLGYDCFWRPIKDFMIYFSTCKDVSWRYVFFRFVNRI